MDTTITKSPQGKGVVDEKLNSTITKKRTSVSSNKEEDVRWLELEPRPIKAMKDPESLFRYNGTMILGGIPKALEVSCEVKIPHKIQMFSKEITYRKNLFSFFVIVPARGFFLPSGGYVPALEGQQGKKTFFQGSNPWAGVGLLGVPSGCLSLSLEGIDYYKGGLWVSLHRLLFFVKS